MVKQVVALRFKFFTQQYENRKVMNNNFTLNIVSHLNKDLSL